MSKNKTCKSFPAGGYGSLVDGIGELLEQARHQAARAVNSLLTAAYWEIGRRIVEFEQGGEARAEYGEALLNTLSSDLTTQHGRGFLPVTCGKYAFFTSAGRFGRQRLPNS
jgi:hypothetical protein